MLHVERSRIAYSLSRLRVIAAIALALLAVAASPARGAETTDTVVLSTETIGAWQVIARRDAAGVDYCIARRELGGTGTDQPSLFEFVRTKGQRSGTGCRLLMENFRLRPAVATEGRSAQ